MGHKGYLILILHAHLPYIRHPEHKYFLEENWLYEAIVESYIPLLDVFDSLLNDDIDFRVAISLSPTVVEMFNDELLQKRCLRYIDNLIELSEKEILRTKGDSSFEPLSIMYNKRFRKIRYLYEESYKRDLTSVFKKLQDSGKVEILTTAATHAYLPTLSLYPQAVKAQIKVALENHIKNFGRQTTGIWLPECGYYPDLDILLKETGIKFFFMESHGLLNGIPTPRYGTYSPVTCPPGVVAFSRDIESSKEVWSSIEGYPGDSVYRDFYRDIGFDLQTNYLKPVIHPDGIRAYTGIKYFRITDKTDVKLPYIREHAIAKAEEHAKRFIINRERHIEFLNATVKFNPAIISPYDMELFGHWWFEGPEWLNLVLRKVAKQNIFKVTTPSEYLCQNLKLQCVQPAMSSWGDRGYNEVWLNYTNNWIYRHIHKAVERMIDLSNLFPDSSASGGGLLRRAMNQAAREILLSQHSDWAFLMKTGTASEYAERRITEHIERFTKLYESIKSNNLDEKLLLELEAKDRIFSEMNYRVYSDHERSLSKG